MVIKALSIACAVAAGLFFLVVLTGNLDKTRTVISGSKQERSEILSDSVLGDKTIGYASANIRSAALILQIEMIQTGGIPSAKEAEAVTEEELAGYNKNMSFFMAKESEAEPVSVICSQPNFYWVCRSFNVGDIGDTFQHHNLLKAQQNSKNAFIKEYYKKSI